MYKCYDRNRAILLEGDDFYNVFSIKIPCLYSLKTAVGRGATIKSLVKFQFGLTIMMQGEAARSDQMYQARTCSAF